VLDAEQVERLKQIQFQAAGAMALMVEEVSEKLKITDDQQQEMRSAMRDLFQPGGGGDRAQMMEKMTAKMMEILTDDQKAAYKKMAGEPFDVSQLPMPGIGGQRRRGGN
jgi:hypothetical protein